MTIAAVDLTLHDLVPPDELGRLLEERYITVRKHPTRDLWIYNYGPKCQYEPYWTAHTRQLRGLIVRGGGGAVVARPFSKFWNLGERVWDAVSGEPIPVVPPDLDQPFEVYEKLDGCFTYRTPLNLWDGGTIPIGEVVSERLTPTLMGMTQDGEIVPCQVVDWFENGTKDNWLSITIDCLPSKKSGCRTGNHLRVTDNHHLYLNGAFRSASEARVGDMLTTFDTEPNDVALHVFEAGLLGDGSMCRGRSQQGTANYQEPHKAAHVEYVDEIRRLLGDCAIAMGRTRSGYGTEMVWASSRQYKALKALREKWYPDGKKQVPKDLSWMDDFTVAKWYMDDGSLSHHEAQQDRAVFATNGFGQDDVRRLAGRLSEMYGVKTTVFYSKGWNLRVNAGRDRAINQMWSCIAPYVHPSMRYKLPVRWREEPYTNCSAGRERKVPTEARILGIERLENTKQVFRNGRTGFDIKTTTGNYFAKGVLVHNSLGIGHLDVDGLPSLATRGSFISEQARRGTEILRARYAAALPTLASHLPTLTFCFEIIYPENRIVVDYADRADVVLLAVLDTRTGRDLPLAQFDDLGFPVARTWACPDFEQIEELCESDELDGQEGFVVRFATGHRVKVKRADYQHLHRLVTGVTPRKVWERLREGWTVDALVNGTPPGYAAWVRGIADGLTARHAEALAQHETLMAGREFPDRRTFAEYAKMAPMSALMFALYDGHSEKAHEIVWKALRPEPADPFRVET